MDTHAFEQIAETIDRLDWFSGPVLQRIDGGDHLGLVLGPMAGGCRQAGSTNLGFQDVRDLEPGRSDLKPGRSA